MDPLRAFAAGNKIARGVALVAGGRQDWGMAGTVLYFFRHTCPRTARRLTTRWRLSEADARERLVAPEAVPGSGLEVAPVVGHGQFLCVGPRTDPPAPPDDPSCR